MKRGALRAGFTLVEVMIGTALGGVALMGALQLNSQLFLLIKSTRETNAASLCLEERSEQLRNLSWNQVTVAQDVANSFFSHAPRCVGVLPDYQETISIEPYPAVATSTPLIVQKRGADAAVVVSNGTSLIKERLVRVEMTITWAGHQRTRVRSATTLVGNSGASRSNLPGSTTGPNPFPEPPNAPPPPPAPSPAPGNGGTRGTVGNGNGKH